MSLDHYYLNLAYLLALQNAGNTAPNPSVGAVVVRDDQLISCAFHPKAGDPHAEVIALQRAGERARGATLYSSLEPCAHKGKTGPCVEPIRLAGISRVVFGAIDQNPLVNGNGAAALRAAGIVADQLPIGTIDQFYAPFFASFRNRRPYLIAKVGMTANGIISPADRNSRWITNETSLTWVHQLRSQCDAILVGADTVMLDRPHLTVRAPGIARSPVRIVIDSRFKLDPEDCSLLEGSTPILICGAQSPPAGREQAWKSKGASIIRFKNPLSLLTNLLEAGIRKIIVEGGQKIFTLFHTAGVIDEYVLMIAPRLLTGKHSLNFLAGPEQSLSETRRYKTDPPLDLDGDIVIRMKRDV